VATLPLALIGLVSSRRRLGLVLGAGVVFMVLASLGRHGFVYPLLLKLPIVGLFRYPVKWMVAVSVLWALLLASGIQSCQRAQDARSRRALWFASGLGGLLGALALLGAWRVSGAPSWFTDLLLADLRGSGSGATAVAALVARRLLAAGLVSIVAGAMLLALRLFPRGRWLWIGGFTVAVVADLVIAGSRVAGLAPPALLAYRPWVLRHLDPDKDGYRTYSVPFPDWSPEKLVAHAPKDWAPAWAWALGQIEVIGPLTGGRWRLYGSFDDDATGLADENLPEVTWLATTAPDERILLRILQLWNVRYVIGVEQERFEFLQRVGQWPSVPLKPLCVWRVPEPLPRAFVVGGARFARGPDALRMAVSRSFEPRREIIVEDQRAEKAVSQDFQGVARTVSRRSDRVEIESLANTAGYAVLVDVYDPGWTAAVDGRPASILRANLVCRAVAVPAGRHTVVFTYRPPAVVWGLALGVLGALLVLTTVGASAGLLARRDRGAGT
jgi:hypothetical protein